MVFNSKPTETTIHNINENATLVQWLKTRPCHGRNRGSNPRRRN